MKRSHRVGALWVFGAIMAGSIHAADPPPRPKAAPAAAAVKPDTGARKPLDLHVGDVRKYMTPDEYSALLASREAERNTVVVEANVPRLPVKSDQPIPSGMPLLPLWWAATHPAQSWRILVPDLKAPPPGPPDNIPPPVFRWGP